MKIAHISDLHLGCKIEKEERIEETKKILGEIEAVIRSENIKIVLITGDVFDSYYPSYNALDTFYEFMKKLSYTVDRVFVIPGNHDSSYFLGVNRHFFKDKGISIFYDLTSGFKTLTEQVVINGESVLVQGLPYISDTKVLYTLLKSDREITISEYNSLYSDIISVFKNIARETKADYKIFMSHLLLELPDIKFTSETEVFSVAKDIFKDNPYNYIALGHIHKAMKVDKLDNIYYAGSIMRLNFSEIEDKKGFYVIDTSTGKVEFKEVNCYSMIEVKKSETIASLNELNDLLTSTPKIPDTIYKFKIVYKPPLTYTQIRDYIKRKYDFVKIDAFLEGTDSKFIDFAINDNTILDFYKSYRNDSDSEIVNRFKDILEEIKNENR